MEERIQTIAQAQAQIISETHERHQADYLRKIEWLMQHDECGGLDYLPDEIFW